MNTINQLPPTRIHSIDVLRGLTILLMIFVNEVAGVRDIPQWLQHMPAGVDGMTIVDWVFPGFLFIVGMSIPLALNNRIQKGDNFWQIQKHILVRTAGLLVLGIFMVNAEGGYNEEAMGMRISIWSLLFYPAAILVWNVYRFEHKKWAYLLQGVGLVGLIVLALIYRGGPEGTQYLQPRWWGILGLIGWAYFYACILYQLLRGNLYLLFLALMVCTLVYIIGHIPLSENVALLGWTRSQAGHATHTGIVLSGIMLTLLFFEQKGDHHLKSRMIRAFIFAMILFAIGFLLRPYFQIGKIGATPSWGLYSAGFSVLTFLAFYWLTDLKQINRWTNFFKPAATQPLLTYIIPFILWALYAQFNFYPLANSYRTGIMGILFCVFYAILIVYMVKGLNKLKIRLHL